MILHLCRAYSCHKVGAFSSVKTFSSVLWDYTVFFEKDYLSYIIVWRTSSIRTLINSVQLTIAWPISKVVVHAIFFFFSIAIHFKNDIFFFIPNFPQIFDFKSQLIQIRHYKSPLFIRGLIKEFKEYFILKNDSTNVGAWAPLSPYNIALFFYQ